MRMQWLIGQRLLLWFIVGVVFALTGDLAFGPGSAPALAATVVPKLGEIARPDTDKSISQLDSGGCPDEQARQERRSTSLPDCRAYELVTPPQKNGALIGALFLQVAPQIASDGERVIAPSIQCFAGPESCVAVRQNEGQPYAFTRTTEGWVPEPLAPPRNFEADSWWSMDADAGTVLFSVPSPPEGQDHYYARGPTKGAFTAIGPAGEDHEDLLSRMGTGEGTVATADLSHIVYETEIPFWSFDPGNPGQTPSLYEYSGTEKDTPQMVGVTGGYEHGENHNLISKCGTSLGSRAPGLQKHDGSLSEDGLTVYFTAKGAEEREGCPPVDELYARIDGELPDARTVLISGPTAEACSTEPCLKNSTDEASARSASFEAAAANGSSVLFTDTQQLTNGASQDETPGSLAGSFCATGAEPGNCNLYESECPNSNRCAQPSERRLIDLSEGTGGAPVPGGPRVQGLLAMSADGSHVYFVAHGVLTGEQENTNHEKAQDGAANLYLYTAGHLTFLAALSSSDAPEWTASAFNSLSANSTPDGRFLVFTSHRALTPDDMREEEPAPAQVYRYDAVTGALTRISIGEEGFNEDGNAGAGDASIATVAHVTQSASAPVRSDPTMSDDGAFVFFQSPVALTPQALNDFQIGIDQEGNHIYAQNVYEYHDGHVFLLTDGKDTTLQSDVEVSPTELLGSDTTGENVFFATFDSLLPEDTDTQRDFYDAHICSESHPCSPPAAGLPGACEGEACHGSAPATPATLTPGSETFTGPGNLTPTAPPPAKPKTAAEIRAEKLAKALKACRRKHIRARRSTCERQAKRRYGAGHGAKRTSTSKAAAHRRGAWR